MHVTINQGLGNAVNLIWDNYEGLSFGTYYLYRDTSLATFTKIDSFPNNIFTYTDANPPVGHNLYYRVGIVDPTGCNPTIKATNYDASKSNTGNRMDAGTGIESLAQELNSVVIYPNPSTGIFNLSLTLVSDKQNIQVRLFNALGELLSVNQYEAQSGSFKKQVNVSGYPAGVYFVQIVGNKNVVTRRIIVQ